MDRLVSLTIGTVGAEDYYVTFGEISELARNLGDNHKYVNVSAQTYDETEESEPDPENENLHYDENTLAKARRVMTNYLVPEAAEALINDLQNAGILFRERAKNEGK